MNNTDKEYFRLLNTILEKGKLKKNRTGINTIGVFGEQAKYDIDLNAFPILTTKKVHFPAIVHELLWFISGSTNIKYLVDNNVRIWNEWAYKKYCDFLKSHPEQTFEHNPHGDMGGNRWRSMTQDEFINEIKNDVNFATAWGELGEGTYGGMWRAFPFYTDQDSFKKSKYIKGEDAEQWSFGEVDQLQKVLDKLKTNPDDRRLIVSAWHPYWVDYCSLPPCHCLFHFNTEELTLNERANIYLSKYGAEAGITFMPPEPMELEFDKLNIPSRKLNCLLYQRSCDTFLGVPFNITSYALLTAMIAHVSGMSCGTFTHTYGDLHIYENHLDQVKLQLSREPKSLPKLWLNPNVKSLFDFKYEDIKLEGYDPHPAIKGEVAV